MHYAGKNAQISLRFSTISAFVSRFNSFTAIGDNDRLLQIA